MTGPADVEAPLVERARFTEHRSRAGRAVFVGRSMNPKKRAPGPAPVPQDNRIAAVPLVLQHQVEPRLRAFAEWFAPGLTPYEHPYRGRLCIEREHDGGRRWRPWKAPINLWRALAAHIAAGADDEAQPFRDDGRALLTALGLSMEPAQRVHALNLDLDGTTQPDGTRYDPAAVIAALLARLGPRFLVTSGSGKPGRYRVLVPIEPLTVRDVQKHAGALLESIGYPAKKGGAEVYPSTTNGRLPFGAGGCCLFAPTLSSSTRLHPYALLDRLTALPRVDLAGAARPPAAPAPALPSRPVFGSEPPPTSAAPLSADDQVRRVRALLAALRPPATSTASSSPALSSRRPTSPATSLDPARIEAELMALVMAAREAGAP